MEAAARAGADGVEFDLQRTADEAWVLFHDDTLDRTTDGSGPVASRTLGELSTLDAGSWFGEAFAGEPVPTLADALELVGRRVRLVFAEVKPSSRPEDVDDLAAIVEGHGELDRTVFISMAWALLDRMRAARPDLAVGYIVEERSRADEALARAAGDPGALVDFDARILLADPGFAERAVAEGTELAVWTVDDPGDAERLVEMGVRAVTTNEVDVLLRWRETR